MTHPLPDEAVEAGARNAVAISALRIALSSFEGDVRVDSLTLSEMEYLAECLRVALLDDLAADGLVVVPREPTQAMLDAIVTYPAELVAARNDPAYTAQMQAVTLAERALAAQRYRAMIEAAREGHPTPPVLRGRSKP